MARKGHYLNIRTNWYAKLLRVSYGFDSRCGCQKNKQPNRVAYFFIQADEGGLVCNQCACALYVIATKSSMASRASVHYTRRLDYIQHFVLIPYRRQAADFIHGFAVILRVAFLYYEPNKIQVYGLGFFYFYSLVQPSPFISWARLIVTNAYLSFL